MSITFAIVTICLAALIGLIVGIVICRHLLPDLRVQVSLAEQKVESAERAAVEQDAEIERLRRDVEAGRMAERAKAAGHKK